MPNSNETGNGSVNAPVQSIRFQNLEAAIWENPGDNGPIYNVTFTRHYRDAEGKWGKTSSIGFNDLPNLAKLANDAHTAIFRMKQDAATQPQEGQAGSQRNVRPQRNRQSAETR